MNKAAGSQINDLLIWGTAGGLLEEPTPWTLVLDILLCISSFPLSSLSGHRRLEPGTPYVREGHVPTSDQRLPPAGQSPGSWCMVLRVFFPNTKGIVFSR